MTTLDYVVGVLGFVLVSASLGLLYGASGAQFPRRNVVAALAAMAIALNVALGVISALSMLRALATVLAALFVARVSRRWPGAWKLAIALTVVTALTVAQPLGVRAEPTAASAPYGRSLDPAGTHSVEILGVPLVKFALYRRERFEPLAAIGECCSPTHTLRVRSWVVPGLLTNATEVVQLCGDLPCWDPGEQPRAGSLRLRQRSGRWHVTLGGEPLGPPAQQWRLGVGVASPWGACFWALATIGIVAVLRRRRRARLPRRDV
jgi:hypothetical protein